MRLLHFVPFPQRHPKENFGGLLKLDFLRAGCPSCLSRIQQCRRNESAVIRHDCQRRTMRNKANFASRRIMSCRAVTSGDDVTTAAAAASAVHLVAVRLVIIAVAVRVGTRPDAERGGTPLFSFITWLIRILSLSPAVCIHQSATLTLTRTLAHPNPNSTLTLTITVTLTVTLQ